MKNTRRVIDMEHHIYVLISQTPTKFGSTIRKVAHQQYNHASIALDENLNETYAFARKYHKAPLLSCLVRESLDRYTLKTDVKVPVVIFKVPVTEIQYCEIKNWIERMYNNNDYVYNLFSVLTYPIFKGFSVKKAFSCIEFVSYILQYIGFLTDKPACKYKPDDLIVELKDYIWKTADIRDVMIYNSDSEVYFSDFRLRFIPKSIVSVCRIIKHGFSLYPNTRNLAMFNINF
jgi:hypothetical protein